MATRICPQCGTETQAPFCRVDGFATVDRGRYLGRDLFAREGDVLAGRYQLDQLIGRTELGSAYRATDLRLSEPVVLRLLAAPLATDLGLIARFQREGRLVASLAHPNIVRVMEHGVAEDGTLFIAQELVAGPSLAEALQRTGPFEAGRVVTLAKELFDALSEAHTHGVMHRSLGLDNVFLETRPGGGEAIKIADFGLVHILADEPDKPFAYPQVLARAWRSMAPEQARGRGVSGHADIYSAGAILYELLAGRPVFSDASPSDLLVAHSVRMPPPPERDGQVLAGPLVDLVMRCLDKKPWNRPDGAQKALDMLELTRAQPLAEASAAPLPKKAKRPTDPYGVRALEPAAVVRRDSAQRIPHVDPIPTDPRGVPRPRTPTGVVHAAPEPALLSSAPGASAARAEAADSGFAAQPRAPGSDSSLSLKRRSPLMWFAAGMLAAALVGAIIVAASGEQRVEPSPIAMRAETPKPAPPKIAATTRRAPEPKPAAPAPPPKAPEPVIAAVDAAGPSEVAAAPLPAPETKPAEAAPALVVVETKPEAPVEAKPVEAKPAEAKPADAKRAPKVARTTPKPRDKAVPKEVDPLADLEDPEFVAKATNKALRSVLVDSEPIGAKVAMSGQIIGETPMYVEWSGDSIDVVVTKVGYRPVRQRLGPSTGRAIRLALEPSN